MCSLTAVFKVGTTAVVSIMWLGVGFAQTLPATVAAVQRGRDTFQQTCAACHGDRGNGKGPAASALQPPPANLTTFVQRKGTFPAAEVAATIMGTGEIRAHGTPGMMVWGAIFLADANGNQAAADARVKDLVAFIQSIQVK